MNWVSTATTRPPHNEAVLCVDGDIMFIARLWESGEWSLDLGGDDECLVIYGAPSHWMRLPEPPR